MMTSINQPRRFRAELAFPEAAARSADAKRPTTLTFIPARWGKKSVCLAHVFEEDV